MSVMRDTLFISHVTPEDNEFTRWLSVKLQLAGYNVWCDLKGLKGGERDYWKTIENEIRNNTAKFILVVSKLTFSRDGVLDEFEFAKSVATDLTINDFIIPLKIDDSPFNARIGQNRYNHIDFSKSWAFGLKALLEKFDVDDVAKQDINEDDHVLIRQENIFPEYTGITEKKETYYSNWWEIRSLPDYLYCYQYLNKEQAVLVSKECKDYPTVNHGNCVVTFDGSIDVIRIRHDLDLISDSDLEIRPQQLYRIPIANILQGFEGDAFPTQEDARYLLKRLLKRTFHLIMKNRGLHWHEMSGKVPCYYFSINKHPKKGVTIPYPNKGKRKQLIGKYYKSKWHFGVSAKTRLFPMLCFSIKSHILFSDNGYNIWNDPDKLHSARRRKGRGLFNEAWRDLLMAFLNGIKSEDKIRINLSKEYVLEMPFFTMSFESSVGYHEPDSEHRQGIISDVHDELEYYGDIET